MREERQRRGRKEVVNDQGDKFSQGAVVCSLGDLFSRLVLWLYCMASVSS